MGRLLKTNTIYFSCVFVLCTCCFLTRTWINTAKYNVLNFLQPNLYQRVAEEKTGRLYYDTVGDTICIKRNVSLSKTALPLTGLVSFPGSGNTWTRHLIQQMTGIGTSTVYCDKRLMRGGFPYECYSHKNKTIVIKAHEVKFFSLFTKIIFLIRNPYDAILAYTNYKTSGHTKHSTEEVLQLEVTESFEKTRKWYLDIATQILQQFKGPVHVLQYEKLKTDMATELRKVAEFLEVNVTEHDIYCTVKLQEGNFHRNTTDEKHIHLLQSIYNTEMLLDIQETARNTERLLKDAYDVDVDLSGPEKQLTVKNYIKALK